MTSRVHSCAGCGVNRTSLNQCRVCTVLFTIRATAGLYWLAMLGAAMGPVAGVIVEKKRAAQQFWHDEVVW